MANSSVIDERVTLFLATSNGHTQTTDSDDQLNRIATINLFRILTKMNATENNILQYLGKFETISKCISVLSNEDFTVSDQLLKVLIASSLPSSWDIFIEPYITSEADMPLQEFLEELKMEFHRHQSE
jgi:hypothetical protein